MSGLYPAFYSLGLEQFKTKLPVKVLNLAISTLIRAKHVVPICSQLLAVYNQGWGMLVIDKDHKKAIKH